MTTQTIDRRRERIYFRWQFNRNAKFLTNVLEKDLSKTHQIFYDKLKVKADSYFSEFLKTDEMTVEIFTEFVKTFFSSQMVMYKYPIYKFAFDQYGIEYLSCPDCWDYETGEIYIYDVMDEEFANL